MLSGVLLVSAGLALCYQVLLLSSYVVLAVTGLRDVLAFRRRDELWGPESPSRTAYAPSVTVVLPVYGEELSVVQSVQCMRRLDYPDLEVLVVNDGSTDATLQVLVDTFDLERVDREPMYGEAEPLLTAGTVRAVWAPREISGLRGLLVVDKTNGGKADALNCGLAYARTRLVCTVDGDSLLEPDALLRVARVFLDDPEGTTAVGGSVRAVNSCLVQDGRVLALHPARSRLALAQTVEYLRSFLGARAGLASVDALLVLSGAFAVFDRNTLLAGGGFITGGLAEDMHATVALHTTAARDRHRSGVRFAADAIVWTEVPEKLWHLRSQRARWQRGLLEVLLHHRRMLFRPRTGRFGNAVLPYTWAFEALGPVIELLGYALVVLAVLFGVLNVPFLVLFLACSLGAGLLLSATGLLLGALGTRPPTSGWWWLVLGVLLEGLLLRPFLAVVRAKAALAAFGGKTDVWGGAARTGFTTVPTPVVDAVGSGNEQPLTVGERA